MLPVSTGVARDGLPSSCVLWGMRCRCDADLKGLPAILLPRPPGLPSLGKFQASRASLSPSQQSAAKADEGGVQRRGMAGEAERTLYWSSGSLFAWRALITLHEKDLPFHSKLIKFMEWEHKSKEFVKINPRGQVPSFRDGDVVIHESAAICLYLEDVYAAHGTRLMPGDVGLRAQVYQRMWESDNIYPACRSLLFADGTDEQRQALRRELGYWNQHLEGVTYLVGDSFTLADACFFPTIAILHRFGLHFHNSGFPNIARYYEALTPRDSIQKSWPPHWKEGPGNGCLANV